MVIETKSPRRAPEEPTHVGAQRPIHTMSRKRLQTLNPKQGSSSRTTPTDSQFTHIERPMLPKYRSYYAPNYDFAKRLKILDTEFALSVSSAGAQTVNGVNAIQAGTALSNRNTQSVELVSWEMLGYWSMPVSKTQLNTDMGDVTVYFDKAPKSGAVTAPADVLYYGGVSVPSYPNFLMSERIDILYQELFALPQIATDAGGQTTDTAGGNTPYAVNDCTKTSLVVRAKGSLEGRTSRYDHATPGGAVNNCKTGLMNVLASNNAGAANWTFTGTFRLTFRGATAGTYTAGGMAKTVRR